MNTDLTGGLLDKDIVELSHLYEELMPVWPTHPKFHKSVEETIAGGDGSYNTLLHMGDHCGTHVDAPAHFIAGGQTIETISPRRLLGRGIKIDVSFLQPNQEISLAMIKDWEARSVAIGAGDIVIFRTGYDQKWRNRPRHQAFIADWPGLSGEGARYLIDKGVNAIGTDAMSLDAYTNSSYPSHQIVLGAGALIIENLANLAILPDAFLFLALPLRIKDGSASPIRAVALV
ncbi:cyclase family protein [Acerihabitans arboris]|uniref:Cyclase family protein n=1 Tax=Acerihabitans arboris TaxID=2691583 RepID=A0A845SK61_9GAMM|nr:cyclase family protein [Acerihabitans arboris]NDL63344.1 cyclase family protein [Acerihabitans arboris]